MLVRYTAFPWPALMAQARRLAMQPEELRAEDLPRILPRLVEGVGRFTSPAKAEAVRLELEHLVRTSR